MPPVEDRPGSTLAKSASRDARVSCETLSHLESFCHKRDVSGGAEKWHDESDLELEQDSEKKAYEDFKPYRSTGGHRFSCFPPRSGLHILPRPFMSPGRHGKRGNDFGGRSLAGVPYSGPLTHSGPIGSIPHSGPLKIGTGSSTSHSTTMKGVSRGHSGPFTMMPPDVIGKKKPPGYGSDEPTSPEVTCIGKVRIKHKHWAKAMEDKRSIDHRKVKWMKKPKGKEKQAETLGREKRSIWHFLGRKEATSGSSHEEGTFEIDPKRSSSRYEASLLVEGKGSDGKGLPSLRSEHGRDDEAVEALSPPLPPTNPLLLMKGWSRNWDRPNEEGVTPAEAVLFTRDINIHMKNEEGERGEMAAITNAPLQRGSSKSMERQSSLPVSCVRKNDSIWKRRSIAQPCALDVRRDDTRTEVVKKQPMTR